MGTIKLTERCYRVTAMYPTHGQECQLLASLALLSTANQTLVAP